MCLVIKANMDSRTALISFLDDEICDNAGGAVHMLKTVQGAHEACEALLSTQFTPAGISTIGRLAGLLGLPTLEAQASPSKVGCSTS